MEARSVYYNVQIYEKIEILPLLAAKFISNISVYLSAFESQRTFSAIIKPRLFCLG